MIQTSAAYREAIVGSPRRTRIRAVVDISDPDKVMGAVAASSSAPWSRPEELTDHNFNAPPRYAALERGRWLLDGSFGIFPDNWQVPEQIGYAGGVLSGADGRFAAAQWVEQTFSGVYVLQALSVFFSSDPIDGVPSDFTVEVRAGGRAVYTRAFTGNRAASVSLDGFTVYTPDAIRLTVTRWSLPGRRVRLTEILLGLYEEWDEHMLERFTVTAQGDFSCLSLPYGSANIAMDNSSRRFEPRRKDGIFQSIEERQGVELYLGTDLPDGVTEWVKVGLYYQAGDGWKTGDNAPTMGWYLVDIIGLVSGRTFLPPDTLPETLAGWMEAVVLQLGEAFRRRFHVDPSYAALPVTAESLEAVTGKTCGDIIRWACQASGTWPRAAAETGRLTAEPLWNQGSKITLDNLNGYPGMSANRSLAALIFKLTSGEEMVVSGNATASEDTITIQNPFLHTREQALEAARLILAQYGGNKLEITGRGDPSSEIGDVDTVWLDESTAATARRMAQTFQMQNGVLKDCRSTLLQADGSYLWTEFAVIRASGRWRAPAGVSQLRIVLGQAGQGGGYGQPGWVGPGGGSSIPGGSSAAGYGDPGQDGQGGAVWYGVIDINPEQEFDVILGEGGAAAAVPGEAGALGGHTAFGAYSSENGRVYPNGYTDIANGQVFARTGVAEPLPGTGDGGKGGEGGEPGEGYWEQQFWSDGRPKGWKFITTKPPGPGHPGVAGATGFAMVTWEKPTKEALYG